ncbi:MULTISPECIES: DUF6286 domain-containing protein [unclassified Aeromicrobium]|uniref:DUF6286 domain-containing protein n=1 Tax=unclassified Aeromicrobium TaxID=2633570 RepID=UPI002096D047|nr:MULTISPECIES: DUF6286 domain-containing protein [unclassified Aeromicrobium]MCO7239685.1 DUF6286 domain-containing protein [Aeromicrobium sp. CnD17-E]MDR6117108.1 hypothetical protein [Aeromicrobium sp. SORGH_AS_0981]
MTSETTPSTGTRPLAAAKSPAGTGASPLVAQLIALALVGLAVVAVQHLLVQLGSVSGSSWLLTVVDAADGIDGRTSAVLAAAVVALVVAVLLLPVALKPRPRRTLALRASSGVHLRRQDLVRVVRAAIDGTDGVTEADVSVRRRRVKVVARSVATADRESELEGAVRARAERVCSAVDPTPRVDVTIRPEKG